MFTTFFQRGQVMFLKYRIIVLFLALGVFAAHEDLSKPSAPFSFVPTGVIYQVNNSANGTSFSYKRMTTGKQGMVFSWSLPKIKTDMIKLSIYTMSGKLIKSFALTSNDKPYVSWNGQNGKMAGGVYLATLSFGQFKKSLKVLY
jgi:hypothetical protein